MNLLPQITLLSAGFIRRESPVIYRKTRHIIVQFNKYLLQMMCCFHQFAPNFDQMVEILFLFERVVLQLEVLQQACWAPLDHAL